MLVRNLMTAPVHTTSPDATIEEAFSVLRKHHVHQLPVVASGEVLGIVTDRDLRRPVDFDHLRSAEAMKRDVVVGDVMTMGVVTVTPITPVVRAARLVLRLGVGAVPVVDRGTLVGILTRTDLLAGLVGILDADRAAHAVGE